jgi:uncharacterized protein (DUF924 family)
MRRLPSADDVHRFWFGQVADWATCVRVNHDRWFARGSEQDDTVRRRFSALQIAAAGGEVDHWCRTPRGALALILALDQFPRHIHRGTPLAFATDDRARAACLEGIALGLDEALSPVEQSFFYLPLEHAEDREAQRHCVTLMRRRADQCPPDLRAFMENAVHFAEVHREIIERFDRFPHRNTVLGRQTTREEADWLAAGGARFGQ